MPLKVLAFSGSLRAKSGNTGLLRLAATVLPEDVTLTIYSLADLPLFNEDLEGKLPESVAAFRAAVVEADALLIATTEHNYSMSAALKNAIDWLSRGYPWGSASPLNYKVVAEIGLAGPGTSLCSQLSTAHSFNFTKTIVCPGSVRVSRWDHNGDNLDENGDLKEPLKAKTAEQLKAFLVTFKDFATRLQGFGKSA